MAPNTATTTEEPTPNADEVALAQAASDHPAVERAYASVWDDDDKPQEFADVSVRIAGDSLPADLLAIARTHKLELERAVYLEQDRERDYPPLFVFEHEDRE